MIQAWWKRAGALMSLALLGVLVGACGVSSSTPGGGSPTSNGSHSATGCPGPMEVLTWRSGPAPARVTPKQDETITITTGQTLEITLAWGQSALLTSGPDASVLRLDTPAGYADSSDRECIWHFTPVAMGQTSLTYTIRPLCNTAQTCPTASTVLHFVVDVTAYERN